MITSRISESSRAVTYVLIGWRSSGGVWITERSRIPASDMCSVRGIGVADSDSTSTATRSSLNRSFCSTPKRCSSSMTTRPEVLELDVALEQAVRPDDDVDRAAAQPCQRMGDIVVGARNATAAGR